MSSVYPHAFQAHVKIEVRSFVRRRRLRNEVPARFGGRIRIGTVYDERPVVDWSNYERSLSYVLEIEPLNFPSVSLPVLN